MPLRAFIPRRLSRAATTAAYLSLGSGLLFGIKIGGLYICQVMGVAPWLSYLALNVILLVCGWAYHSAVTFKVALNAGTALRYALGSIGLVILDYLGFLLLTYLLQIQPLLSAVIMAGLQFGSRMLLFSSYVFKGQAAQ